ncbi:MAG: DUF4266 domain-containing protein [Acidobacteria bacterium]|nr:DUF4266 domain-containing protein [Acidobacteriota bacterium]
MTYLAGLCLLLMATACVKVKPWQRETLTLDPMQLDNTAIGIFDRNAEVYREGAVGGAGGKSGGGCGCS